MISVTRPINIEYKICKKKSFGGALNNILLLLYVGTELSQRKFKKFKSKSSCQSCQLKGDKRDPEARPFFELSLHPDLVASDSLASACQVVEKDMGKGGWI